MRKIKKEARKNSIKKQIKTRKIFNFKQIKIKNFPRFILVAIILLLIILIGLYYLFLYYKPETIIPYAGYAIEPKMMEENLKSGNKEEIEKTIDLVKVEDQDILFKRLNGYYIGGKEKQRIDIQYPIYINENQAILNLSEDTKLITVNYEEVEGYPEFTITGGIMYNGSDLTRADGNEYLFLKNAEEIYTNVKETTIKTTYNTYTIPINSNIHFAEEEIRYYELKDGYLEYKEIEDVDVNSEITINEEVMKYEEFLKRLQIIEEPEENNTENVEETETNETEKQETEETPPTEEPENEENTNPNTSEPVEGEWVKPTISCTDFEGEVYTAKTTLTINDPSGVTTGIMFEMEREGKLYRRLQVTSGGRIEIGGLSPDTEFVVRGIYTYTTEEGEEIEEQFYEGGFRTKGIETLGTIKLQFENGEIYPNKIELQKLKLENEITEEVMRGISRIEIEIDGITYKLKSSEISELRQGKEITYQSSENVESNKQIKYTFTIYDKYGNELKVENREGETRTSKEKPSVRVTLEEQDITVVTMNIKLTNNDHVTLNNYKYQITASNGDVVQENALKESDRKLEIKDLNPNDYYTIKIYADLDLEDNKGEQKEQVIGETTFTTLPLSSLGYLVLNSETQELAQNTAKMGIGIDEDRTDKRLIEIIETIQIRFIPQIEEDGEKTQDKNKEIREQILTQEQIEQLRQGETLSLEFNRLESNTKYKIEIIASIKQGEIEEKVECTYTLQEITTLKMPAKVQIRNQFVTGNMIDFDVRIEDIDGASLTNTVRIEVRNEENELIELEEMGTNEEYARKTYNDLEENKTYTILFYAPQYNEGSDDSTYQADYLIKEIKIVTESGISGEIGLETLERKGTGKNLIDVSSKVNWYEKCFNIPNAYGLHYDENTKIVTIGGTSSYQRLTYYDLSEFLGQEVTISFKARTSDNTYIQIIEKATDDFNSVDSNKYYYTINDLAADWKEYSYTVTLSKTGYIGFKINDNNTEVEIKELQIELGNQKTNYEEFKYASNARMNINLIDLKDEITNNDYYVRIYKNNEQVEEIRYEEIGEENKIENAKKDYNVESNATYKLELLVKIRDRYYTLDSEEFETGEGKEIKGISSLNDFLKIQPYGEYIVLEDLDFSGVSGTTYRFGTDSLKFEGKVDFNGKEIIKDNKNLSSELFCDIGENGIIENIVLNVKLNREIEGYYRGLCYRNYGTIRNIQVNVTECTRLPNADIEIINSANYSTGIIENFVIHLEVPLYMQRGGAMVCRDTNRGTIQNGYVYGENIKAIFGMGGSSAYNIAMITYNNSNSGVIRNVYSLSNIDYSEDSTAHNVGTNIAYNNIDNASIENVYSVGIGENVNQFTSGPNVWNSNVRVNNSYYFADEIFTGGYDTKGNKLSLWDVSFQNQILNTDGQFEVDELVSRGYYPQVKMSEKMPRQEYIELPEVEDADLPDILSTEVIEQGSQTVKVKFSVNNPSAEQIDSIEIENLTTTILLQEYADGKSTVIAELTNPIVCVSQYDVLRIRTKGAFNITYTREYEEGERKINVDLYKEIWSVQDWKNIANSTTENYMLMTDLDFINEGNSVNLYRVDGIINGSNYKIANIKLENTFLINNLYGELRNLEIINFEQECVQGGLINTAQAGAMIDNVHMSNVNIKMTGSGYCGGIVRSGTQNTISNSSVTNINITIEREQIANESYIGGILGIASNENINNCYVRNLNILNTNAINTTTGGILGRETGRVTIRNCYAEGKIASDVPNTGGIIGYASSSVIENCYAKVNITSSNKYVGGIIGTYTATNSGYDYNVKNNLSIGNLYTTEEDTLDRVTGNKRTFEAENYAYENQLINGYVTDEQLGATLLNRDRVLQFNLGEAYAYETDTSKGVLPKLYNTEGTELLKNQTDIFLENHVDLTIEQVEAEKRNTTEAEITLLINNPQDLEITKIEIEDMTTSITRNVTQNGETSITVRATPNRYYDSYKITNIKYKIGEEEQEQEVEAKVDIQFYKEIYSYEDWQTIEEGTYQNYRLMADIDFSGKSEMKHNITVNRLEAENHTYTLKNIELTFQQVNTGLINEVRNSIKNIKFENITLTNTANLGNYFGIIAVNNGSLENLAFSHVTIKAPKVSYVGMIGNHQGKDVKNIELQDIYIEANTRVGGLIGCQGSISTDSIISDITGNDVEIIGTDYTGGILGNVNSARIQVQNIDLENSMIIGNNSVGGILGYGGGQYLTSYNNQITGNSNVGGISGLTAYSWISSYLETNSCKIKATGNYIGGISGQIVSGLQYVNVIHTEIESTSVNAQNVGGINGDPNSQPISFIQVKDTNIKSKGINVGGISGNTKNGGAIAYGYVQNVTIEGAKNVGGIVGNSIYKNIYYIYVNATVKATSNTAGGVIGYIENKNTTAVSNVTKIYNSMVVDTSVEAPTNAGGLVGNMDTELYKNIDLLYNNYVDADIVSSDNYTSSLLIGGMATENPYVKNSYVYRYSKINDQYVYETDDVIEESQYLVRDDLETQNTYTGKIGLGTTYFSYNSLTEGKYPKITDRYIYKPELQEGVDLPVDPSDLSTNMELMSLEPEENGEEQANATQGNAQEDANTQNGTDLETVEEQSLETQNNELPEITAYPISVSEINIDFSHIPENTYFTYYVNGEEKGRSLIERRTYTFAYNFQDTIEIRLEKLAKENKAESDMENNAGNNTENAASPIEETKTITITPEDLQNKISMTNGTYAYLQGNTLYIGNEAQEGEYVHLYEGKALTKDGNIYHIETRTEEETAQVVTKLEEETKPRKTYDYQGNAINVYGTYSTINGNVKAQIYTVKNGRLSAISNKVDMKIGEEVVDSYNEKDYQTILGTDGIIYDLKEKLNYPENFENKDIEQIEVDANNPMVMVYYTNGKVVVFHYVTGEEIYNNNVKENISLFAYIKESFTNPKLLYENTEKEYEQGQELIEKLEETPISLAITMNQLENTQGNNEQKDNQEGNTTESTENNVTNEENSGSNTTRTTNKNYISVYNPETKNYDIYEEAALIKSNEEEPETENAKIQANGLEEFYNTNITKGEKIQNINGFMIVKISIMAILIILLILRKNMRNNMKANVRKNVRINVKNNKKNGNK